MILGPLLRGGEQYKYQEEGCEKMKYVILGELKEPVEENWIKVLEIEKERGKREKQWDTISMYNLLSEPKMLIIVETDDESLIAKYINDYRSVAKMKISPIMDRSEYEKAIK
jgi:hypothetical protein